MNERNGDTINTGLIPSVISSFVDLGFDDRHKSYGLNNDHSNDSRWNALKVYEDGFEKKFLEESTHYYQREADECFVSLSITEYMKRVEQRLNEESKRVHVYLHESTNVKLALILETVFIQNHLEDLRVEFQNLLNQDKDDDLGRIYMLVSRTVNGLIGLKTTLEQHIAKQGMQAIDKIVATSSNDPKVYVETILDIHGKFKSLVVTAFTNDSGFVSALDKACNKFINVNSITQLQPNNQLSRSPELFAKYCDLLMKKSSKNPEEAELEDKLTRVMTGFNYLTDKDVFQKFYYKLLANRLVFRTSASDDAEASMIMKLSTACGLEYTRNMQQLIKDVRVSSDLNEKYKQFLTDNQQLSSNSKMDLDIQVFATISWPFSEGSQVRLPMELEQSVQRFDRYYTNIHPKRKLKWIYSISKGELVTNFLKSRYIFQSSTFQMAILLQYNAQTSWTFKELLESTGENF